MAPSQKPEDIETRSVISMQELDPSPVQDDFPDIESGEYVPKPRDPQSQQTATSGRSGISTPGFGLRGHNWDSWLSALQKYSTYPPSFFFVLHFANTSLIPLATRSVADSETYLLLTRPVYQSPSLEHAVLTIPILVHIASGVALRNIRSSRRARLYGAETRSQRYMLSFWPRMSLQARLGYFLAPLIGTHVLVNRVTPLLADGGSSGVGLGYVAHGFARSPVFWNIYYLLFVAVGVWHIVGGWAAWMGWRVTTARKELRSKKGSLEGYLGYPENDQRTKKQRKMWWVVNGIAAVGASIWLAGALGIIGRAGQGTGWEASSWNEIYSHVPVIGAWFLPRGQVQPSPFRSCSSLFRRMEESPSAPVPEQLVQHEGKEYRVIKEGLACILNPASQAAASEATRKDLKEDDELQSVFYNPIQQFNRDLSVLAVRVHGEHVQALKKRNAEKKKRRAAEREAAKGKKRKRDEQGEVEQESKVEGEEANHATNGNERTSASKPEPSTPPSFTVLDALSATGLRALRYASEIPFVTRVVANDLSAPAIESMKMNIRYNKLDKLVQPNNGDARAYMYNVNPSASQDGGVYTGKFDVIDLDPYGTASPFMDATLNAVKDGGMLCVTCTDAGVWASNGYPEKAFSLYGGVPIKGSHSHEGGLRLILHALATSAAKYGLAIEPLLSLSIDFYARVFVRVYRSPADVKFLSGKTMLVYNCDVGCGAWTTQPLTATKQRLDKRGNPFYHYGFTQGPLADRHCAQCGTKTHMAGPMWAGPLHNVAFIQRILDLLPKLDRSVYHTIPRIEGMLTTALEEDFNIGDPLERQSPEPTTPELQDAPENEYAAIIPRLDPSLREQHPFYFTLSALSKVLKTSTIPFDAFRGALRRLGYRSTRSHTKPNTVRTDAPWDVIWEVMREWVRQKSPVKEGALKPGSAGAVIMAKGRDRQNAPQADTPLDCLRREILSALDSGRDVSDLVTKVEAALYRCGSRQSLGKEPAAADRAPQDSAPGEDAQLTKAKSDGNPSPNELEIVFDEDLGRETFKRKRLVRYQINPRANWGPLNRASGKR
ncbi:S-adenosyl-L-methionine-dependent methyltransferase [Aspergillus floccosus]